MIDFFESRQVGAIQINFKDDSSYKIYYYAGNLGPGA